MLKLLATPEEVIEWAAAFDMSDPDQAKHVTATLEVLITASVFFNNVIYSRSVAIHSQVEATAGRLIKQVLEPDTGDDEDEPPFSYIDQYNH